MVEFAVVLLAGVSMAVDPEGALRLGGRLGPAIEHFKDALQMPIAPLWGRRPEPQPPSRRAMWAMRGFGVAVAALGFAGLAMGR